MTHSNSNRVRLTGRLIKSKHRYLLQCEDENVWRLSLLDVVVPVGADNVTVEGFRSGIDNVEVDWIGAKQ